MRPYYQTGAALASKKSKTKRTDTSYLDSAKTLARFVPALKKYRRRKTLNRWEKGAITRKEKLLAFHSQHLIPVDKKTARKLKNQLFAPGVRAIELRNTSPDARIRRIGDDMIVTSNGRTWLYWRLDRKDKRSMRKAGEQAFGMQLPVERVAELVGLAFEELKPLAVALWATTGRVGETFGSLKQFLRWLDDTFDLRTGGSFANSEPDKWVNGIAILLNDPDFRKPRSTLKPPRGKK